MNDNEKRHALRAEKVRDLLLHEVTPDRKLPHLSAASGIVEVEGVLYVVADDELGLGCFPVLSEKDSRNGQMHTLFHGTLPEDVKSRKQSKPDLEAISLLPFRGDNEEALLLAVPSGSKENRRMGALVHLPSLAFDLVDFSALFEAFRTVGFPLNIEGAVFTESTATFFQRGNGKKGQNALFSLPMEHVKRGLFQNRIESPLELKTVLCDLGKISGVPLSFTDAISWGKDSIGNETYLFLAAAEDTEDAVADGNCIGSVIGVVNAKGAVLHTADLEPRMKAEGLTAHSNTVHSNTISIVTDADEPSSPGSLYRLEVPTAWR